MDQSEIEAYREHAIKTITEYYDKQQAATRELHNAKFVAEMDRIKAQSLARKLLAALKEASCWTIKTGGGSPAERGAKCETAHDMHEMVAAAIVAAEEQL